MPQATPDPELSEIAAELGKLAPTPSRVNRDRLMYEAGYAAGRSTARRGWVWPSIAATLAFVVLAESAALTSRREPRVVVVERGAPPTDEVSGGLATVQILAQAPPAEPSSRTRELDEAGDVFRTRRHLLEDGLEALPAGTPLLSRAEAATGSELSRSSTGPLRRSDFSRFLQPGGPS